MAKAELNLDISESTAQLALSIIESWLNYDREHRSVMFKKDADDKYKIMLLNEKSKIKAPDVVACVACSNCGREQYWQGRNKCISCGKKLSF